MHQGALLLSEWYTLDSDLGGVRSKKEKKEVSPYFLNPLTPGGGAEGAVRPTLL